MAKRNAGVVLEGLAQTDAYRALVKTTLSVAKATATRLSHKKAKLVFEPPHDEPEEYAAWPESFQKLIAATAAHGCPR
ncbi:MAG: hypothetical protein QM831_43475 [Kofleriaceae bacterium]